MRFTGHRALDQAALAAARDRDAGSMVKDARLRDESQPFLELGRLIGRERERARLDRLLATLTGSRQRCLVVSGEPGIGKSALLRHVRDEAERLRYQALFGAASEVERDVPFGLMIAALDDRLRELPDGFLARVCGAELAEVALVFPAAAHLSAPSSPRLQEE